MYFNLNTSKPSSVYLLKNFTIFFHQPAAQCYIKPMFLGKDDTIISYNTSAFKVYKVYHSITSPT